MRAFAQDSRENHRMHRPLSRRAAALLLAAPFAAPLGAFADSYPNKPVRLVVPFAPGGGADVVGRLLAQRLSESMKAQFVVDNKSGAGGVIGTDIVAKSAPDGYTLLLAPSSHVVNPSVYARLPYDTERAFEPISLVASATVLLAANAKVPAKDLRSFIAAVRSGNAQLANYGSAGNGTVFHLVAEQFRRSTQLDLQHVAYRGGGPATAALVAGEIPILFETAITLQPHVKSGAVIPYAVTSPQRSALFPNVPTIAELGYPELTVSNDYALYAPAGTPKAVIRQLSQAVLKVANSSDFKARLWVQGATVPATSPEQLAAYVKREIQRWNGVARQARITAD
jgi:tripartite-type tricarboxylate transporter receptor subunit TctC